MSCFCQVSFISCSIEEAVDPVSSTQFRTWRKLLAAFRHGIWTAGMQATAARRVDQTWWLPTFAHGQYTLSRRRLLAVTLLVSGPDSIRVRCGREQELGIGTFSSLDHLSTGPTLYHLASINYQRLIG